MLVLCVVLLFASCEAAVHNTLVIGGGVGGAATAFYLRQFCNSKTQLVEQRQRLGGRLKSVEFSGQSVNVGGDAWATSNNYLRQLQKELSFPLDGNASNGNNKFGIWDGKTFYSPTTSATVAVEMEVARAKLSLSYFEIGDKPFSSIAEYLSFGTLSSLASVSTNSFVSKWGLEKFAFTSWTPATRVIYNQDLRINLFSSIVSLLAAAETSYSFAGGNDKMVELLANKSQAKITLGVRISSVQQSANGLYVVPELPGQQFNSVVLASPIEFAGIKFAFNTSSVQPRAYRHWFVTLVEASGLNPAAFGGVNPVPDTVFTTANTTTPWTMFSVLALSKTAPGKKIYKGFSNVDVSNQLSSLFLGLGQVYVQQWPWTFPDLSPAKSYQPIVLAPNVYYLNTMESVATAMEGSVIAARNIALTICKKR